MRSMLSILLFTCLTMLCWGVYGPTLHEGKSEMGDSTGLRPFICVGIAYFIVAIIVPLIYLQTFGENGRWTAAGTFWSLIAGAVGALGALGVILAFVYRGSPLYVMPVVFGCAPVVNTFLTMYMTKTYNQIGPVFIAGLILVIAGAVTVLVARPRHPPHPIAATTVDEDAAQPVTEAPHAPEEAKLTPGELSMVFLFTAMTALCWGVYGPTLHKGQGAMAGSRLRPLICVGVSYFLIAVVVPSLLLVLWSEPFDFPVRGTLWSLAGGATGAIGALGVIMAFNSGGKPIYVMPLIFGGAPVINTFVSLWQTDAFGQLSPIFYAGLIVVIVGAVTVLVFAPRLGKKEPGEQTLPESTPEAAHA